MIDLSSALLMTGRRLVLTRDGVETTFLAHEGSRRWTAPAEPSLRAGDMVRDDAQAWTVRVVEVGVRGLQHFTLA